MKIVSIRKWRVGAAGSDRRGCRSAVASPNVSPTPRRRATLASLAAELKVSRTTVSNAFNRPDQLSPELRERVLATAKRMGYAGPDPVARSLRTRKAGAVGLVMAEAADLFLQRPGGAGFRCGSGAIVRRAWAGTAAGGRRTQPQPRRTERPPCSAPGWTASWCIRSATTIPTCRSVLQRRLPVVVVDQPKNLSGVSRVGIDDRAAMRELADYVLGLGHREIGLLTMRLGRDRRQDLVDAERLQVADLRRAARTHHRRLGRDDGRRRRPGFADRGGKLREPADVGRRRRQGGVRGQSADHRADVHRRRLGPVGHGLPSGTWHLRSRSDERSPGSTGCPTRSAAG